MYSPITQKQADSARIHERLAAHKTPLMVTSANFALVGNTGLGSTKTWGLGNTALTKYARQLHVLSCSNCSVVHDACTAAT